jgi:hypothetical protein
MNIPNMPVEQGGLLALLIKYKVVAYLASLSGALLIAMTNPPKTRKGLFYHAIAALITTFLFGEFGVSLLANWVDIPRADLLIPVYGFIGSMGWGIAGGLSTFSERFAKDPVQAVKDVKDVV